MPRDLFGDVTRPSISIGNRKWYTVPVSLLSHAIIVAMIVIVPILAAPLMPGVLDGARLTKFIDIVPPTPPSAPRKPTEIKPADPNVPPTVIPDGFTKEPEIVRSVEVDVPGVIGGTENIETILVPPEPAPKPPEPKPGPVRVGGTIRQPVKIGGADPVYPPMAQAARIQGIVIIEATLAADGHVMNARVLRSVPMLDPAALDAVRTWEYTPTLLNGVPVPVIMTVTVQFTLAR
ncbi:MAG TPA: TonB family protein [Vicinamibacterales bacterium]|nr:TonB family protein [Vicinamibacterales bacterium]